MALAGRHRLCVNQICDAVKEASQGGKILPNGTVYPNLYTLQREGLIQRDPIDPDEQIGGIIYYVITEKGEQALQAVEEYRTALMNWKPSYES